MQHARTPSAAHLVVTLGDIRFVTPVAQVEKVARMAWITPVTGGPSDLVGVVDLAGRVVPVFDPRPRFGAATHPIRITDRLLFIRVNSPGTAETAPEGVAGNQDDETAQGRLVALWVDDAADVVRLDERGAPLGTALETAVLIPDDAVWKRLGRVRGVARLESGLAVAPDLRRFLTDEEAGELDAALRGGLDSSPDGMALQDVERIGESENTGQPPRAAETGAERLDGESSARCEQDACETPRTEASASDNARGES